MSRAIIVAGLAWGDEGKGAAVDYLTRQMLEAQPWPPPVIVRYNGGPQAAHNVVTPEGDHHTFAQYGSGLLAVRGRDPVRTHLSRFMLVNPLQMTVEVEYLKNLGINTKYTSVDPMAVIITPYDKYLNRLREKMRGGKIHGTCGQGVGEARNYSLVNTEDALMAGDLRDRFITRLKLRLRHLRLLDTMQFLGAMGIDYPVEFDQPNYVKELAEKYYEWTHTTYILTTNAVLNMGKPAIFEGAQGVLLDEREEFAPHNTWTKTTFENAETLLREAGFKGEVHRIGCIRSYMTRHGAGPFRQDKSLDFLPELHNNGEGFQGEFRRGHFDISSVKKALDIVGGVDEIHMSHIDQLSLIYPGMDMAGEERFVANTERLLETPITVLGYGPKATDRKKRHGDVVNTRRRDNQTSAGLSLSAAG